MKLTSENLAIFGKGKTGSKVIEVIKNKYDLDPMVFDSKNIPTKSSLKNIKYIFSEKDKLARFNPENILLQNIDHDKDIVILEDVGHFPYFESPEETNKALISIIKK